MNYFIRVCLIVFSFVPVLLEAQTISSTFRVGLNFSNVNGPSEKAADGTSLDSYEGATGFHIGGGASLKFDGNFGVRGEVLFSQKGFKYRYEGPSFQRLQTLSGNPVFVNGDRRSVLNITNNYISLPVTGFVKLWDRIEFYGGGYVSFLVGSRAEGETILQNGVSLNNGNNIPDYTINLDYNYLKDNSITPQDLQGQSDAITFVADREEVVLPRTQSAYYGYERKDGKFYNGIDAGIIGGVKGFINQGLFVGLGLSFGLVDITNNNYDFDQMSLDSNNQVIQNDDNDRNFAVQLSVGFSF